MAKRGNKDTGNKQGKTESAAEITVKESPVEKAMKLGDAEIIARAIQDMLKRDGKRLH